MVTVVTASDLVNVTQLNFIASQEDEAKVLLLPMPQVLTDGCIVVDYDCVDGDDDYGDGDEDRAAAAAAADAGDYDSNDDDRDDDDDSKYDSDNNGNDDCNYD